MRYAYKLSYRTCTFYSLLSKFDFPDMSFTLYFLGYEPLENIPDDPTERVNLSCLFWNWLDMRFVDDLDVSAEGMLGIDAQLGHRIRRLSLSQWQFRPQRIWTHWILRSRCLRCLWAIWKVQTSPFAHSWHIFLHRLGVEFVKTPDSGKMKGLAFIKDPDGYWIEILNNENMTKICPWQNDSF